MDRTVIVVIGCLSLLFNSGTVVRAQDSDDVVRRQAAEEASDRLLRQKWETFFLRRNLRAPAAPAALVREDRFLPAPQRRQLALNTTAAFQEPDVIASTGGVLNATLTVDYGRYTIGGDPVRLRSYVNASGKLVGPTLRARAGDVLSIQLVNNLPANPSGPLHNTHHEWNTTNLHTHGLHVSPSGNSDNVLLSVLPGAQQSYDIEIPANHPAGTFWYHAHRHGSVSGQVSSGMAGALVITGAIDAVPAIAAAKERIWILQQIPYFNQGLPEGRIELTEAGELFGPGDWDASGRFTTVNGVVLPVVTIRPGEVERWRIVDGAFRERIDLKLERASGAGPAILPFHEIAVDGLSLGKVVPRTVLELWPGYRSDVLVQAPLEKGEYLVVDEQVPVGAGINGNGKDRRHIAKLVIAGAANPMALPTNAALAPFRPTSIPATQVTGTQSATYGINVVGSELQFQIDGRSYGTEYVRPLTLGKTEEWTLRSVNGVGPVTHPFHIHVNPFEVVSVTVDATGQPDSNESVSVWRDTLAIKPGRTYKVRMTYADFTGDFVQHCHILDHEDLGMMELVRIGGESQPLAGLPNPHSGSSPPARSDDTAAFAERIDLLRLDDVLLDRVGARRRFSEFGGKPCVVLFFQGASCPHCVEQLETFARELRDGGVPIIAVSAAGELDLRELPDLPITLLADPDHALFRKFGAYRKGPLHGTFVVDQNSRVVWQYVGSSPTMDTVAVQLALRQLGPQVALEVRNTQAGEDDYLTWSPTPARIRVIPETVQEDLVVTLTNDPQQPIPQGRTTPLDGDVWFAEIVSPGQTASADTVTLRLPRDGTWIPFIVAGKFPRASTSDKDVVIEVHEGAAGGPLITTHPVMVRVRKRIDTLTPTERDEFLKAVADLHKSRQRYEWYVALHRLATAHDRRLGDSMDWPDQAHDGSAFITWHRAFLLQFERELQQRFPHVSLPYWVQGETQTFFSPEFLGLSPPSSSSPPEFDTLNPLHGWSISLRHDPPLPTQPTQAMGPLRRSVRDHNVAPSGIFTMWPSFQNVDRFSNFVPSTFGGSPRPASLEVSPHNNGHGFVGPRGRWMSNCRESNADPVFWVFHCYHDYLWAKWQHYGNRFDTGGGPNGRHYAPTGSYRHGNPDPLGHHLDDAMWPWDGTVGQQPPGDANAMRPDRNTYGPFPPAPHGHLWPTDAAAPTPADMIDYLGINSGRLAHGFCYDDVPFGATHEVIRDPIAGSGLTDDVARLAINTFLDPGAAVDNRVLAANLIHGQAVMQDVAKIAGILADDTVPAAVREKALDLLFDTAPDQAVPAALRMLGINQRSVLGRRAIDRLGAAMHFSQMTPEQRRQTHDAFVAAAQSDAGPEFVAAAVAELAAMGAQEAEPLLAGYVSDPASCPLPLPEAVSMLRNYAGQRELLRKQLAARNPDVLRAALESLWDDTESEPVRRERATDGTLPTAVRVAAIRSLVQSSPNAIDLFLKLFDDATAPADVREEAAAALRDSVLAHRTTFPEVRKQAILGTLEGMSKTLPAGSRLERLRLLAAEAIQSVLADKLK